MNRLIVIGFVATFAAAVSGFKIPATLEWYYWPVAFALCVVAAAITRILREVA